MSQDDLRDRVAAYLASHHTMTVATLGPRETEGPAPQAGALSHEGDLPHAASVFYAMDVSLRLVFLSKPSSLHGLHIARSGAVAATVTEDYGNWELIQGVQLWGEARLLSGAARVKAMALYVARFPFVREMLKQRRLAELIAGIGVYQVVPRRLAFTDNTTGVFGREVLELECN
jgi:uncharacterized protein YhbP (UPF0306 family)